MKVSALSLVALLLLSACGFTPMYASNNGTSGQATTPKSGFNQIDIDIIPNREGQYLRNALIDRFYSNGTPSAYEYNLSFTPITETISNFDITVDSEATRRQIKLSTTIALASKETKKVILKRKLLAVTSHNVLESEFSTLVTEQSAREAALNDLARQVERQLALYFN